VNGHADPRAFTYAVGASLALHAVLLVLRAPELHAPPAIPGVTITAHLAEPEAPPPAAVPVEPKPEPRVEKPKPRPKVERQVERKVERPKPVVPAPSTFSVAPAPAPVEAPAEPAPAPPIEKPSVASAPAAAPAPPAPDLNTLIAQYRSQFIGAAVRFKRYPPAARDNGWEGDVVVHLEVSASGELGELKVKKSSGHPVLDQQALEMFRRASPQVPLPSALRGRAFGFDVRAVYSLKD
jgi:protein TonB